MTGGKRVRSAAKGIYKYAAKPLLFRQHPDDVHESMVRTSRLVGRLAKSLTILRYRNSRLHQQVLGIHVVNPVGLSAGLDKNFDLPVVMKSVGAGFEIGGSTTAEACVGNPRPWFHRLPEEKSIVVHVGLANNGVDRAVETLQKYPATLWRDFPLSVSVAKTNNPENVSDDVAIQDYCESLRKLEAAGVAHMYEINISCPNTYGGEPFTTPDRLEKLLSETDKIGLTKPVFLKMPTDKTDDEYRALLTVADRHQVDGLAIGNLMKDRQALAHPERLSDDIQGSLSGIPAQSRTTELIRTTYQAYGTRFVIIGIGGIFTAEDAYEKIRAGATLVALVTALMFEGPQVIGEINEGLVRLLDRDGFASIAEAVGADYRSGV